jgi:hypothetical protein
MIEVNSCESFQEMLVTNPENAGRRDIQPRQSLSVPSPQFAWRDFRRCQHEPGTERSLNAAFC